MKQTIVFFQVITTLFLLFFAFGCSSTDSEHIDTSAIYADIKVEASGGGDTTVTVDLNVGSGLVGTGIVLSSGDTLTATDGKDVKPLLKETDIMSNVEYKATFNTEVEDTKFTIAFKRSNGDHAENSYVTLPAPINLTAPAVETTITQNTNIEFNWSPSNQNDPMEMDVDCFCEKTAAGGTPESYWSNSFPVTDNGIVRYTLGELMNEPSPQQYNLGCDIEVTLKRKRFGTVDPNYGEGGSIEAVQKRTVMIHYTPSAQ